MASPEATSSVRCPACGFESPAGFRFCGGCGSSLPTSPAPAPSERPAESAERRQLTVLFCDLVGSTALSEQLDPEELREVLRAVQSSAGAVVERFGGHVAQHLGDGLLVYFGFPRAHEDSPRRAVDAGLEIVRAIERLDERWRLPEPLSLAVRIGIHTGRVVTGEMGSGTTREHLALGEAPNVAARVQGLAEPGTVLVSGSTAQLTRGFFQLDPLGEREIRGLSRPVELHRVVSARLVRDRLAPAAERGLSPHVGREIELGGLLAGLEKTRAGHGTSLLLVGEAGIGKSRLVHRLRERIDPAAVTVWSAHCSAYHANSALYPVIELLHELAGLDRESPPAVRRARLERLLEGLEPEAGEPVPVEPLAELLSLAAPARPADPADRREQRERTYQALLRLFLGAAERRPVVLVVEDLHWADPSTLELLERLAERAPGSPFLVVMTARPEIEATWSHGVGTLRLDRLKDDDARRIVLGRRGGDRLPPRVVDRLVARADGVPLFLEELTEMALEADWPEELEAAEERNLPELDIPATLHDSLASRLDRLDAGKTVAQWASVLGREFVPEALHILFDDRATVDRGLAELERAGLVLADGPRHVFKHALVRDVAYGSLLHRHRAGLHGQIARRIVERFPETAVTQPELVAHHYTEAGEQVTAARHWLAAGRRAAERAADREATSHFRQGVTLLEQEDGDGDRRLLLELYQHLGPVLMAVEGYGSPAVERSYRRALELSERLHPTDGAAERFPALLGLLRCYAARARLDASHELGEELLALAERADDPQLLREALRPLGGVLFHVGELGRSLELLDRALALHDAEGRRGSTIPHAEDPGVFCLAYGAWALWHLGYPDRALARSREAMRRADQLSHPFSRAYALAFAAVVHQLRREPREVLALAEETLAVAGEHGFPHRLAMGRYLRGWARVELAAFDRPGGALDRERDAGLAEMEEGLDAWRACGAKVLRPQLLTLLALGHLSAGQPEEGLPLLDAAREARRETGESYYDAGVIAAEGEIHLALAGGDRTGRERARRAFAEARQVARRQGALSLELGATNGLARLLARENRRREARSLLEEIVGRFPEGGITAGLGEAWALLDELG